VDLWCKPVARLCCGYRIFEVNFNERETPVGWSLAKDTILCHSLMRKELYSTGKDSGKTKRYLAVIAGNTLPELEPSEDIIPIQPLGRRRFLFEIIDIRELAKQGVHGFGFKYPGLLKPETDLWKAIKDLEEKESA
jgi:hypothetical protein